MITGVSPILSLLWTLVLFSFTVAWIVALVWGFVDVVRRPSAAFKTAGSSKRMWVALLAVFGVLLPYIGAIVALVYMLAVRPRIRAVMDRTGNHLVQVPSSFDAGPTQGWYPDPQDPAYLRFWDGQSWTDQRTSTSRPPA
jgi:hypothetical protein